MTGHGGSIKAERKMNIFICKLGEKLGLNMANYEMDGEYIRSKNFTSNTEWNFEPISSLMGENEDYSDCFDTIYALSPVLAEQYLKIVWLDTVCYNMDRHTENFGFLRDVKSGKIVSMAPNYDNNIALISRGYPAKVSREGDGLIRFFRDFLAENQTAQRMYQRMQMPTITENMIDQCLAEIPIQVDEEFIKAFVLNGQQVVHELILSQNLAEDMREDQTINMTL